MMKNPEDRDPKAPEWEVLDRHFAGEDVVDERTFVAGWLALSTADERLGRALRSPIDPATFPDPHLFAARIDRAIDREAAAMPAKRQSMGRHRSFALAAVSSAMVLCAGWLGWQRIQAGETLVRSYATVRAERTTVSLPDGSRVMLAPETELRYAETKRGDRRVTLTGQAFFTVQSDPAHPFMVQTAGTVTKVLGTAFDVRHYANEPAVRVTVVSGRVSAKPSARGTDARVLGPGHVGVLTDSAIAVRTDSAMLRAVEWTRGKLSFSGAPVPEMLQSVGRWYGYEFRLAGRDSAALAAQHVSATFDVRRPNDVLTTIKALLGVTMTFEKNVVTLRAEPSEVAVPRRRGVQFMDSTRQREVGK
jgi:ferric-dicitrate binding protein FerR (iron transport regulator)